MVIARRRGDVGSLDWLPPWINCRIGHQNFEMILNCWLRIPQTTTWNVSTYLHDRFVSVRLTAKLYASVAGTLLRLLP